MDLLKYLMLFLFLFVSCSHELPTETNHSLFGLYKSSTFIEPGSLDGGVDIQANGGYLNITLFYSYEFTAELLIPETIQSNYAEGVWHYKGIYKLESDTLNFISGGFIIKYLRWDKQNNQLESFEAPARGRPFKIILKLSRR